MTDTIILVLLISIAVLGALAALSVSVRGDGTLSHGPRPTSRHTRPEDAYLPYLLSRDLYHR